MFIFTPITEQLLSTTKRHYDVSNFHHTITRLYDGAALREYMSFSYKYSHRRREKVALDRSKNNTEKSRVSRRKNYAKLIYCPDPQAAYFCPCL